MNRRELMLRSGVYAASAAVMGGGSGCATLLGLAQKYVKIPQLTLKDMQITKATLSTLSVKFLASINNPNPVGFFLEGLEYALALAGGDVAKGTAPKGVKLAARGKADTELDIDFDIGKSAQAILELLLKKSVPYGISTVGKFRAANQTFDVPAKLEGRMPMPLVPKLNIRNFNVQSAGLNGVGFRLETEVKNDNDFEIPVDGMEFDVKIGGHNVLQNKVVRGLRVAKNKTGVVPLDFHVNLAELGLSAIELAANPRLNWEIASKLRSGKFELPFNDRGSVRLG